MDGFKAWTTTGLFQIDGSTFNFQLAQTANVNTSVQNLPTVTNNAGTQYYVGYNAAVFTFTANSPLLAFRLSGAVKGTLWSCTRNGNTYTATVIAQSACTVTFFIFDQQPAYSDNYGLKVYNGSGQLVANAIQPFAKVIDVIDGQYFPGTGWFASGGQMPGNNPQTQDYSSLGVYSICIAAVWSAHYMESTGNGQAGSGSTNMSGIYTSGTTVGWEFLTYAGTRSGNFVGFKECTHYRFMVLDMTSIA
jgi:hypothetical protein